MNQNNDGEVFTLPQERVDNNDSRMAASQALLQAARFDQASKPAAIDKFIAPEKSLDMTVPINDAQCHKNAEDIRNAMKTGDIKEVRKLLQYLQDHPDQIKTTNKYLNEMFSKTEPKQERAPISLQLKNTDKGPVLQLYANFQQPCIDDPKSDVFLSAAIGSNGFEDATIVYAPGLNKKLDAYKPNPATVLKAIAEKMDPAKEDEGTKHK